MFLKKTFSSIYSIACNQAVALKLHGVDVDIQIIKRKGEALVVKDTSTILLPTNTLTSNSELDSAYKPAKDLSNNTGAIDIMIAAVENCRPNGNGNLLQYQTNCRCCRNECSNMMKNISALAISSTCTCPGECCFFCIVTPLNLP